MYPFIAAILSFLSATQTVFAVGADTINTTPNAPITTDVKFTSPFSNATITDVLNRIVDYGLAIAGSLAAVMILWGAFQIMTSKGDSKKVTNGRHTIIYALGGLVIIILARGLVAIFRGLIIGLGA